MIDQERKSEENPKFAAQELPVLFKKHWPNIGQMLRSLQLLAAFVNSHNQNDNERQEIQTTCKELSRQYYSLEIIEGLLNDGSIFNESANELNKKSLLDLMARLESILGRYQAKFSSPRYQKWLDDVES